MLIHNYPVEQLSEVTIFHCADCNEYYNSSYEVVRLSDYEDYERYGLLTIEEKQCQMCKDFYMSEDSKY